MLRPELSPCQKCPPLGNIQHYMTHIYGKCVFLSVRMETRQRETRAKGLKHYRIFNIAKKKITKGSGSEVKKKLLVWRRPELGAIIRYSGEGGGVFVQTFFLFQAQGLLNIVFHKFDTITYLFYIISRKELFISPLDRDAAQRCTCLMTWISCGWEAWTVYIVLSLVSC